MKDPKEVMRAYSKEEFPELTKALNKSDKQSMIKFIENLVDIVPHRPVNYEFMRSVMLETMAAMGEGGKKLRVMYVGDNIPEFLQQLADTKQIEFVEPQKGKTAEFIITDEFAKEADQDCRFGEETLPLRIKKSQSNNPSDRWIKPKKLRRAKGGRK